MILLQDNASVVMIKNIVTDVFTYRFQQSSGTHIADWQTNFPCLDIIVSSSLEVLFNEEALLALKNVDNNKFLGPDGFPLKFA